MAVSFRLDQTAQTSQTGPLPIRLAGLLLLGYRSPRFFIRWVLVSQASHTPLRKLPVAHRLALAGFAIVGMLLLITARSLEPDSRGYGTHEQLGITPCYFLIITGHPCPTCGATTAWSHTLHGNLAQAVTANLGGALSCAATIVGVPWLLLTAALGRWPFAKPRLRPLLILATAWLLMVLLDWMRRVFFG